MTSQNVIVVYISQAGGEVQSLRDLIDGKEVELQWVGSLNGADVPIRVRLADEDEDDFEEESYVLHYTSADGPGDEATWSVYRERYVTPDSEVPIDGSQEYVSTHPSERSADDEARRLQAGLVIEERS